MAGSRQLEHIEHIEHAGVVHTVSDRLIQVRVTPTSACAGCRARGVCGAGSDNADKIIDIHRWHGDYRVGEKVIVSMRPALAFAALWWGYLCPFLVVIISLIGMIAVSGREILSGLIAVGALIPYYFVLFLLKSRFKRTFIFDIKKTSNNNV